MISTRGNVIISGQLEEVSPVHQREIQKFISRQDREKRRNQTVIMAPSNIAVDIVVVLFAKNKLKRKKSPAWAKDV